MDSSLRFTKERQPWSSLVLVSISLLELCRIGAKRRAENVLTTRAFVDRVNLAHCRQHACCRLSRAPRVFTAVVASSACTGGAVQQRGGTA
jgi:hypothetical protein